MFTIASHEAGLLPYVDLIDGIGWRLAIDARLSARRVAALLPRDEDR